MSDTMRAAGLPAQISRRDLLLGALLAGSAAVAFARLPRTPIVALAPGGDFDAAVPEQVGPWRRVVDDGFVLPPEDEQQAAAVYQEQLARSYTNGVDPLVMLLIAYDRSQSGMLMIHRPESCYPGSGFEITAIRDVTVPLAPGLVAAGRFLSTARGTRIEHVLYWTRLGNGFPASWDAQRRSIAMQNLQGLIPDGALVRMSMITPDAQQALVSLRRFAAALYAASGRDGRALLAGPANVSGAPSASAGSAAARG